MRFTKRYSALSLMMLSPFVTADSMDDLNNLAGESVKGAFSTASLLSDNDVVKLGFFNFNPNDVIGTDNEALGSEDATSLRSGIDQFNFPLNITSEKNAGNTWRLGARASYVNIEQELFLGANVDGMGDELTDRVISLSLGGGLTHEINKNWQVSADVNVAWMKYRSRINYRTDVDDSVKQTLNGLIVNYDVEMLMFEPVASLKYSWESYGADFSLSTDFHYLHGFTLDTENPAHDVEPNEWYVFGSLNVSQPVAFFDAAGQSMKYRFSRVELSNLLADEMGSGHYYEAEIGWVKETEDDDAYIREYGVGINFNYGSVLKGGTLVLYYTF